MEGDAPRVLAPLDLVCITPAGTENLDIVNPTGIHIRDSDRFQFAIAECAINETGRNAVLVTEA